jgi:hypothetical protein
MDRERRVNLYLSGGNQIIVNDSDSCAVGAVKEKGSR